MIRVTVEYLAALRDKAGTRSEEVSTLATDFRELYCEIAARHGFLLPVASIKAVVRDEFVEMGTAIKDGDKVSFLPPVAGG